MLPMLCFLFQTQANTRKWLVEQSLKVPESQQLKPQVCVHAGRHVCVHVAAINVRVSVALYLGDPMNPISFHECLFAIVSSQN